MIDLSLVPFEDLVKEIENRSSCFVMAYQTFEDKDKSEMKSIYGKGTWSRAIALSSMLNNDVLNNWNNELKTLQRINEENSDE